MGLASSKLPNNPATYATPFVPAVSNIVTEDESSRWAAYDYVIVGGGAAGCVLASRLSEDRNNTVLLLEAGGNQEGVLFSRIPLAFAEMLRGPHDWRYSSVPQKHLGGRSIEFPRGKILGGTSSINAMIYHHCDPEDFDAWEQRGAPGWGSGTMKKYFDKMLKGGPRIATDLPVAPISDAIIAAAEGLGIPHRKNFNTREGTKGAGVFYGAVDEKHERSSSATSYLSADVRQRPNLTIAVCVHTERILFTAGDGGSPRAVGAQISTTRNGPKFAVKANREVIVCGGVFGSPQVLLLSGVGPAADLQKLNIPVVRDLPAVGQGLLDHVTPGSMLFRARPGWTWDHITQSKPSSAVALLRWLMFGSGPMSALCAHTAIFTRSDDKSLPYGPDLPFQDTCSGPTAPDLEFLVFPMAIINYGTGFPPKGNYGISVGPILLKPLSAGTVSIGSNSVYDAPLIDPNFFAEQSDLNVAIRAVRLMLRLARTPPLSDALDLRNYASKPTDPNYAEYYWIGDADPDKVSDEEIKAFIRKYAQSSTHPTSSARMGQDPARSVVDLELRVHGVAGLRVVDASVFPDEVSGHPCVPVMAVAERAADLIKGVA